jgi:hypothetical protein
MRFLRSAPVFIGNRRSSLPKTACAALGFATVLMLPLSPTGAMAEVGAAKPGVRRSVHFAMGCREPRDVVKVANHVPASGCRAINLRWVKIETYDIRIGNTEMILVEHPFYGQVYVQRPQE